MRMLRSKWLVIASVIAILATILGLVMDPKGFSVNVLAGLTGAFIGIGVSVIIIERLLKEQHAQESRNTRKVLIDGIINQLNSAVREYLDLLPTIGQYRELLEQPDQLSSARIKSLKQLYDELLSQNPDDLRDKYVQLYPSVRLMISKLTDLQLWYMVTPSANNDLIVSLHHVNASLAAWDKVMLKNEVRGIASTEIIDKSLATLSTIMNSLEQCIEASSEQD